MDINFLMRTILKLIQLQPIYIFKNLNLHITTQKFKN